MRPDIELAERHQTIDISRPPTNPPNGQQRFARLCAGKSIDGRKPQSFGHHVLREAMDIRRLLPREPHAAQAVFAQHDHMTRGEPPTLYTASSAQPAVHGTRRYQRYLLFEDQPHERGKSGRSHPERRQAMGVGQSRKSRFDLNKGRNPLAQRVSVEPGWAVRS